LANDQPPDRELASEILNYFARNPHAADTLEGVTRYRLMHQVIWHRLNETEAALEWLVGQGYLTKSISPGGTATFSLNADRAEEARRYLTGSLRQDGRREQPR
jgi:hypothetical protein